MVSAATPFLLFNQCLPFLPFIKCLFLPLLLPDPPQPPVINGLEGEEVQAGRLLLLQCVSYGGNPLATLHWTKVSLSCHLLWRHCQQLLLTLSVPQTCWSSASSERRGSLHFLEGGHWGTEVHQRPPPDDQPSRQSGRAVLWECQSCVPISSVCEPQNHCALWVNIM